MENKISLNIRGGRNQAIDLIKIYAMLGVLMLHVNVKPAFCNYSTYYIMTGFAGLAMPLFFMVSGYLLIGRSNERSNFSYTFRKIFGIIRFVTLTTLIYGILITLVKRDVNEIYRTIHSLYGNYLQAPHSNLGQYWYFGSMIIIYLVYPIINRLYNNHKRLFVNILVALSVICMTTYIQQFPHIKAYSIQPLRLWNWLFYFMLGALVKDIKVRPSFWLLLICSASYIYLFYYYIQNTKCYTAEFSFSSPVSMIYALMLFSYFANLRFKKFSVVVDHLSQTFLPVYFMQWPIINQMWNHADFSLQIGPFAPILCWLLSAIVCVGLALVIMHFQVGRWIFKI